MSPVGWREQNSQRASVRRETVAAGGGAGFHSQLSGDTQGPLTSDNPPPPLHTTLPGSYQTEETSATKCYNDAYTRTLPL